MLFCLTSRELAGEDGTPTPYAYKSSVTIICGTCGGNSAQCEEQAYNLQKNGPGTQNDVFKEAGHTLFVDEPGRFNPFVRDFVARLAN